MHKNKAVVVSYRTLHVKQKNASILELSVGKLVTEALQATYGPLPRAAPYSPRRCLPFIPWFIISLAL